MSKYTLGPDVPPDELVRDSKGNVIDEDYIAQAVQDVHDAVAGRPSLSSQGTSPRVSFRVPTDVREAAERLANREGVSLSELARRALEERVRNAS
jgi:predicted HicB family RNase H-like nuclease